MGSRRADVPSPDANGGHEPDLLVAAESLRWARPDLTGALADHVLETAAANGDRDRWLEAAGWVVHARSATGDGRVVASDVLDGLAQWGEAPLVGVPVLRLRVELAALAIAAGEVRTARLLLTPAVSHAADATLRFDAYSALARCAAVDRPDQGTEAVRQAELACSEVEGDRGQVVGAALSVVAAAGERRAGRAASAVDRAADGLARLDRGPAATRGTTPSGHLAAALAAEWIAGLLDTGRPEDARDACVPVARRLAELTRPTRQSALLRLTMARVAATGQDHAVATEALERATSDAAGSDMPQLEAVCRSTLGALHEQAGRVELAIDVLGLGVAAQRRDRSRADRFLTALRNVVGPEVAAERERHEVPTGSPSLRPSRWALAEALEDRAAVRSRNGAVHGHAEDVGHGVLRSQGSNGGDPRPEPDRGPGADRAGLSSRDGRAGDRRNGSAPDEAWPGRWTGAGAGRHFRPQGTSPGDRGGSNGTHDADEDAPAGGLSIGDRAVEGFGGPEGTLETDRNRRSINPWSTGRWSSGAAPEPAAEQVAPNGRGKVVDLFATGAGSAAPAPAAGRHTGDTGPGNAHHDAPDPHVRPPIEPLPATDAESWLQTALAEIEQALGRPLSVRPTAAPDAPEDTAGLDTAGLDTAVGAAGRRSPVPDAGRAFSGRDAGGFAPADAGRVAPADDAEHPTDPWSARAGSGGDTCVVVVDVAREGRRFAGRRAGAVVHAVADALADRLPAGARLQHDAAGALSVVLPNWGRTSATEWMYRTLPGLLEGVDTVENLPDARLRAAVHDAGGPVGAQLLQRIDPGPRQPVADAVTDAPASSSRLGRAWPDAADTVPEGMGGRPQRRNPRSVEAALPAPEPPSFGGWSPVTREAAASARRGASRDSAPRGGSAGGRHGGGGRASFTMDGLPARPGSGGRRYRPAEGPDPASGSRTAESTSPASRPAPPGSGRTSAAPPAAADPPGPAPSGRGQGDRPEPPRSTEGLGLADLLAGALDAYRAI